MGLKALVEKESACSLPGVDIKFNTFMLVMRRAQSRGYVRDADALFVEKGLRNGFEVGVKRSALKGKRVFRNYPPAFEARTQITAAISRRIVKGRTVQLGPWAEVRSRLDEVASDYVVFPMGAVEKAPAADAKPSDIKIMRPTSDHTRTGLNAATAMDQLRHSLNTYKEVAWLLKQNYFMYVADVEDAFLLIPLAPWLWFFFLFRYFAADADRNETTAVHIAGDFGAAGMPGTFKIFFVDVVIQMARSELVLTVPMPVYVDDCGAIDAILEYESKYKLGIVRSLRTLLEGSRVKRGLHLPALTGLYITKLEAFICGERGWRWVRRTGCDRERERESDDRDCALVVARCFLIGRSPANQK